MISLKKIYYVPGLISALLIPFLFWYYVHPPIDQTIYNVIDLGLPARLEKDKSNINSTLEPFRSWKYEQIKVQPNTAKENSAVYVSKIKQFQKGNKKISGIEFILDENNTYGDFVSLLNDMHIAKQDTYGVDIGKTGHIFAIINYPNQNSPQEKVECLLCYDVIYTEVEPTFMGRISDFINKKYTETFFENISKLPPGAYYIIFGFLLLLNISMLSIKEKLQLQKFHHS
ncbi:hypothetical protein VUJ46_22200 [Chryseobacterium sp. MYb264]|uniref:hypothetical protein n=1 Tax=Chryseobacterium sp. MYb264 TaxID=2745153 RepID=UPI002E10DC02|nr:hypothetical protein VUJ46_22200 [Chryseobacterium sp. MYb264]